MNEEWKPASLNYSVSNFGRVKSIPRKVKNRFGYRITPEKILTPTHNGTGYLIVGFSFRGSKQNFLVHRLVASLFVENPLNLPEINHKDGDKTNNKSDNLEWCTHQQNIDHSISTGLTDQNGEKHHSSKLTQIQVDEIREEYSRGKTSYSKLGRKYKTNPFTIRNMVKGYTWKQSFNKK